MAGIGGLMASCFQYQVSGRVQGVGYRMWTQTEALGLGITGYVRNMENGDVEVVACGTSGALALLQSRLFMGPRYAKVENVESEARSGEAFESFVIRYR